MLFRLLSSEFTLIVQLVYRRCIFIRKFTLTLIERSWYTEYYCNHSAHNKILIKQVGEN